MKKCFTLIELLVVVAIMAILFSILLPSLVRAKGKAKETLCLSNEQQIYLIFATYGSDWDNRWVAPKRNLTRFWLGEMWTISNPNDGEMPQSTRVDGVYTKIMDSIWYCPEIGEVTNWLRAGHAMNYRLPPAGQSSSFNEAVVMFPAPEKIKKPSSTILITDDQNCWHIISGNNNYLEQLY